MFEATLINDDCMKVIKKQPFSKIDMILTDPPYKISAGRRGGLYRNSGRISLEEIHDLKIHEGINIHEFLDACVPLFKIKDDFCGVFFCSEKQIIDYLTWAELNQFRHNIGVWHKTNPIPTCKFKYLNDIEYWIYIIGSNSRIHGNYTSKSMLYSSQINMNDKKKYRHPTIKPVKLIEKFILNHSIKGATIFDPFMGTGSTGVACKNMSRNFIGIEMINKWFKIAEQRINSSTLQNFFK